MDLPKVRLLLAAQLWVGRPGLKQLHTQTLCSLQGRRKACLSVGTGELGERPEGAQASGLDQDPFLGWKSQVRRAKVFPLTSFQDSFPGKRQQSFLFSALASSRLERPGTTEMPGPPVIRAGRK